MRGQNLLIIDIKEMSHISESIDSIFNNIIEENIPVSGKEYPLWYKRHSKHQMDRTRRETFYVILLLEHYTEQIKAAENFKREGLSHT